MLRVIVTGAEGQLGRAIAMLSEGSADSYTLMSRSGLDICDMASIEQQLTEHSADIVVNCAAYTDVEGAEVDEASALSVNRDGVALLAKACHRRNIPLIHISTDYVFGGDSERTTPYNEDDGVAPINVYGRSKAEGESVALSHNAIVIRTAWLYSPWGKNFLRTILRVASERTEIEVVDDQRGTPTSALSLARAIMEIIGERRYRSMCGIYHYTDGGEATWYDFAQEIVHEAGITTCEVRRCSTADRGLKARRPTYSVLKDNRLDKIGITRDRWQDELRRVMALLRA